MPHDWRTMMGPEPCSSQHPPLLQAFRQRGGQEAEWQHHVMQLAVSTCTFIFFCQRQPQPQFKNHGFKEMPKMIAKVTIGDANWHLK